LALTALSRSRATENEKTAQRRSIIRCCLFRRRRIRPVSVLIQKSNFDIENQVTEELRSENAQLRADNERLRRYETALRGAKVTIYTQDRALRYTSLSTSVLGRAVGDMIGATDEQIFPGGAGAALTALKSEVLETGQAKRGEIAIDDVVGTRWHDLHVEPLHNEAGEIVGLSGAAVDVTERKEGEAHLRLLLRELTHRSKNLLAVIQAMARQTARHAGSTDAFLTQFGARLQALAASHDLLVRESWYGAALQELVQSQLAAYADLDRSQITVDGPAVALKPEAAQNLGLALHELAANAVRFGALSVPEGKVSIAWQRVPSEDGEALSLDWREELGPRVRMRRKKGFGSMVIERNLTLALEAKVDLDFDPEGLHCLIVIPASQIVSSR
jgi:two-component sensor histidine kinase